MAALPPSSSHPFPAGGDGHDGNHHDPGAAAAGPRRAPAAAVRPAPGTPSGAAAVAPAAAAPGRPEPPKPRKGKGKGTGTFFLLIFLVLALLTVLTVLGILPKRHDEEQRNQTSQAQLAGAQTVEVTKPTFAPATFEFSLPGNAEALQQATLYARTNGYLKERLVDIGDHVEAGQLLAVIDAPDVDAQLGQARAQLEQFRAALTIAQVTYDRQKQLLGQRVVSKQDYDQSEATYRQAVANVRSGEANVQNLSVQQGFQRITAPFRGVITARLLDVGALIAIGTGNSAPSLFTIADTDVLRIFINVPQAYVTGLKAGQEVAVSAAEFGRQVFKGKITRTADALDPSTRTERVEIQLPSEEGKLLPGMYLNVKFTVARAEPALVIPANTLDVRREGPRVAVVNPDNHVAFRPVALGRDFGTTVEVVNGLQGGESIVVNPNTNLVEGSPVRVDRKEPPVTAGPAGGDKKPAAPEKPGRG